MPLTRTRTTGLDSRASNDRRVSCGVNSRHNDSGHNDGLGRGRAHTGLACIALLSAAAVGSSCLASVVDNPNGFVLRSNGNIALEGAVHAGGSLGALGSATLGWGAFADGNIETGASHTWAAPTISSWTTPPGSSIDVGWSQTRSLTAGAYGALTSNSSTTINLGPGSYTFSSFQLGWSSNVIADTSAGDVYMYVQGALTAADATRFQANGPGALYLVTQGNSSFGYQANIEAAIYSGGSLSFGGATELTGLAYASGNISAGYGSNFTYAAVPGPGALALLPMAAGIAVGGGRRRRPARA